MEEERLWKFGKPAWLNSAWARNAGVYAAGALVRLFLASLPLRLSAFPSLCLSVSLPLYLFPSHSPTSSGSKRVALRQHAFIPNASI